MFTANNIFPSQQPNKILSKSRFTSYQTIQEANRQKLKTIQAQYFQNEYNKILTAKQRQKDAERLEKQKERMEAMAKKNAYVQQMQRQMEKKQMQKAFLSSDYQNTIDNRQQKNQNQRQLNKIIEKQVNSSPTWIRDANTDRQTNMRKKLYYNQVLQQQVRLQQQRKLSEQKFDQFEQQKLRRQADEMLRKQFYEMEAKHRQKNLFEQRQNELLGIGTEQSNLEDSRTYLDRQRQLKNNQREIYRQGLHVQYEKQQNQRNQRKRANSQNKQELNPRYNPITNPIPFVYKNPNVLRMLNQF